VERTAVVNGLVDGAVHLRRVREELDEVDRRLAEARVLVEDLRLRATVSETPVAAEQLIVAQQHVDLLLRTSEQLADWVSETRRSQDHLLDLLPKSSR